MGHDSFICHVGHSNMTRVFHMWCNSHLYICDAMYLYIRDAHDVRMRSHVPCEWVMSHIHTRRNVLIMWVIRIWNGLFICDVTHTYLTQLIHMGHDSFIWDITHLYGTWLIRIWNELFICDVTHTEVSRLIHMGHDSFIWDITHSYVM